MTSQTAARSCLVLAPHPDDETLGCGATIIRKLATGASVRVVIATDGRHSPRPNKLSIDAFAEIREEEARRACAILGLSAEDITFLRLEDGRLADHRRSLRNRLLDLLETINPAEVFVSSIIDNHPDHRVLGELARELTQVRPGGPCGLYEYPIWFWDPRLWRIRDLLELRICTVRMDEFRIRKHEAIAAYGSQITNVTDERNGAALRRGFLRSFWGPKRPFSKSSAPDEIGPRQILFRGDGYPL
jgi:LmbE family N-acetylglucosaminyl deacetylase